MKVIGAGLPRTATTTTLVAFEQLGFGPCYHMRDVFADLDRGLDLWEAVVAGRPDWDEIFGDAQSSCDFPSSRYYRELLEYYPEAKVVLSVRSAEGWVRSMRETIWPMYFGDSILHHICQARRQVEPNWNRFIELMMIMTWNEGTGAMPEYDTDEQLAAGMERWNAEVVASVPADRLLVWDPADGWEPLCEFLEVAVPEGSVPRVNDTAAFIEGMLGGGLAKLNAWWDEREHSASGLHGAPA
ncbi:MAG TPA: sulfotransferase [Solirubrobacteraceae bacterium]|jgi:hypothetical protein